MERIYSSRSYLNVNINKLKEWLSERSFSEDISNKEMKQTFETLTNGSINKFKKYTQDNSQKGIPLVLTYDCLIIIVTRLNRCLLLGPSSQS